MPPITTTTLQVTSCQVVVINPLPQPITNAQSITIAVVKLTTCVLKTTILSWLQNDGTRGFSLEETTFADVSTRYSSCL